MSQILDYEILDSMDLVFISVLHKVPTFLELWKKTKLQLMMIMIMIITEGCKDATIPESTKWISRNIWC